MQSLSNRLASFRLAIPLFVGLAGATSVHADTQTFSMGQPITEVEWFFQWTHHNGLYIQDGVTAYTRTIPPPKSFGYQFRFFDDGSGGSLAQTIDYGYATHPTAWNTNVRGMVHSIDVSYRDGLFGADGTVFQTGSVVWNSTTGEFFRALLNTPVDAVTPVSRTFLTPLDYCLMGPGDVCTAITSFGSGALHTGVVVRADGTNAAANFPGAQFYDFSATFRGVNAVPEGSATWMTALGLATCFAGSRLRNRRQRAG